MFELQDSRFTNDDDSLQSCASSFAEAAFNAAIAKPTVSVGQLVSKARGEQFSYMDDTASSPDPYSARWHATHAGTAVGMILPFALIAASRRNGVGMLRFTGI